MNQYMYLQTPHLSIVGIVVANNMFMISNIGF